MGEELHYDLNESPEMNYDHYRFFDQDEKTKKVRVYPSYSYYQYQGKQYKIIATTTTLQLWMSDIQDKYFINPVQELSFFDYLIPPAYALSTTTYLHDGTGFVRKEDANFNTAWSAASGTYKEDSGDSHTQVPHAYIWYNSPSYYRIGRGYYPFNTTGLADLCGSCEMDISSSTFYFYCELKDDENTDYSYLNLCEQNQDDPDGLTLDDYNNWTDLYYDCQKGSSDYDITSIGTTAYNPFQLNAEGLSWINTSDYTYIGMRTGWDIEGQAPAAGERDYVYTNHPGSTNPLSYLEIEYSCDCGSSPAASSTDYDYSGISIITGTGTTTDGQYRRTTIHIPALIILFLMILLIPVWTRLNIEFLIRWRR